MCLAQALFLSPPVSPQSPPGMEIAGWDKVGSPFLSPEKCARAFSLLSQQETNKAAKAHPSSQVHKSISHSPRKCPFLSYLRRLFLPGGHPPTGRRPWTCKLAKRQGERAKEKENSCTYVPWQEPRGAWPYYFVTYQAARAWEQACMHNPKRDQKRGLPAACW